MSNEIQLSPLEIAAVRYLQIVEEEARQADKQARDLRQALLTDLAAAHQVPDRATIRITNVEKGRAFWFLHPQSASSPKEETPSNPDAPTSSSSPSPSETTVT